MPITPITIGAPFNWQQVVDNVTAYWPEFVPSLSSSDSQGSPIQDKFLAILAMMVPPSMAARPDFVGGLPQSGDPRSGSLNSNVAPTTCADTFYFVESGSFVTFDAAQGDCNNILAADIFPTLNIDGSSPDLPLYLGLAYTEYTDGAMHICTASVAARAPTP